MTRLSCFSLVFSLLVLVTVGMAVSCQGGSEDQRTGAVVTDGSGSDPGSGSGSDEWIQPNCVDNTLADSDDGVDDGESCEGDDAEVFCTIVSECPSYCVSCSDGVSSGCYPCSP
jgi:hypothetical protein